MGRLITEEAVIDVLKQTGIIQDNDLGHCVVDEIKRIPTAYDVDKVVEELEENKKTATNCSSIFDTQAYVRLDKAREIVRKGCVKNDR